ncbi:MAG: ABC transporter substrate-binding protein [Opitutaceae bacterium]|nr:ABC transporter substrate-binding protein [Opitutaceae bacterium]
MGCGRREAPPASSTAEQKTPLRQLIFQSDWFPQAEHGGFYQALAKGYYREAGLDVEILPGGPGAGIKLKIAKGDADLGMMRSDDVALAVSQGLPLLIVGATLQHDAEALLVHADSPVKTLADLAGRTVIAPISMTFIPFIQKRYGIQFNLIPTTYGLAAFLANKDAIQTCFLTSEPFYARQRGVAVRVLPVTDAGYDVYQAIACRQKLAREEPEVVRAFVAASIRGWRDYMENDPTPANRLILERNRDMTPEQIAYSRQAMHDHALVAGHADRGEGIGRLSLTRIQGEIDLLREFKVLETPLTAAQVATVEFLPPADR